MFTVIKSIEVMEICLTMRKTPDGSNDINPDYSAAYVILKTNNPLALEGTALNIISRRKNPEEIIL